MISLPNTMQTLIIILLVLASFAAPSLQDSTPEPIFLGNMCLISSGNYSKPSTYQHNLQSVLSTLKSNSSSSSFYESTAGNGSDTIYGRYYCRLDVSLETCTACIHAATAQIVSGCPSSKESIAWYERCTLLYLNSSSRLDALDFESFPAIVLNDPLNVTDPDKFSPVLMATMNRIINGSAYGTGFATAEAKVSPFQTLYSLAQCSWDTTGLLCERCLRRAIHEGTRCCKDARRLDYFYATCQLRYSVLAPFYDVRLSSPPAPPPALISGALSTAPDQPLQQGNKSAVGRSGINIIKMGFVTSLTTFMLLMRN